MSGSMPDVPLPSQGDPMSKLLDGDVGEYYNSDTRINDGDETRPWGTLLTCIQSPRMFMKFKRHRHVNWDCQSLRGLQRVSGDGYREAPRRSSSFYFSPITLARMSYPNSLASRLERLQILARKL